MARKGAQAKGTRQARNDWESEFKANEDQRLARAAENHARAVQTRQNAKAVAKKKFDEKRQHVLEERANDVLVFQEKVRVR